MAFTKRVLLGMAALAALLFGYLVFWPVPINALAWSPPTGADLSTCRTGGSVTRVAGAEDLHGAEAILIDADGALLTGLNDGRVVKVANGAIEVVADTLGRPLGIKRAADGALLVADAQRGLLRITGGTVEVLAGGHAGAPFIFADDLDIGADGTVYFSDASTRFGVKQWREDIVEHGSTGRILAWDPATRATRVLASGLSFPNGVAMAPDGASLVFAETADYTLSRLHLTGDKRGTIETIAVLPGFPDNVTWSAERGAYLVALGSPRNPVLDLLADWPRLREVILRLPMAVQPKPKNITIVVAVTDAGAQDCMMFNGADAYAPAASAVEKDGAMFLGGFAATGIGRFVPAAR